MKLFIKSTLIMSLAALLFTACKKDSENKEPQGNVTIGITDRRGDALKAGEDIIDASKLTKFEITVSGVELRKKEGGAIEALAGEVTFDLRNLQGEVGEILSANVPQGEYTGVIIYFSGVSITYDGNNYTASTAEDPVLTIGGFSVSTGIPNAFNSEVGVDITFNFEVTQDYSPAFNITFDAVGACYEIEFDCPACTPVTQYFAGLRPIIEKHMGIYFEEGIQQIKYSPPLGIQYGGGSTASYYGMHTFVDFNGVGGTITGHTSQHVYRGTDGALAVDIGVMMENSTPLTPNTINPTGTTDVRADEVFDFAAVIDELGGTYTFEAGSTYYFSLKKTWTIISDGIEYNITRMCEPIPVVWPALN